MSAVDRDVLQAEPIQKANVLTPPVAPLGKTLIQPEPVARSTERIWGNHYSVRKTQSIKRPATNTLKSPITEQEVHRAYHLLGTITRMNKCAWVFLGRNGAAAMTELCSAILRLPPRPWFIDQMGRAMLFLPQTVTGFPMLTSLQNSNCWWTPMALPQAGVTQLLLTK